MTLSWGHWLVSPVDLVREPTDRADVAVAERARAGDLDALRSIYEDVGPRVLRFLRDMLRDSYAADDALQETFARVVQRIGTLDEPERLVSWIFGIARRVCQEQRRQAARHPLAASDPDEHAPASHEHTPEAILGAVQSAAVLERAISKLSADRRAILLMRCDHFMSYDQIADAMTCSVAKVKVELHRARAALREELMVVGGVS